MKVRIKTYLILGVTACGLLVILYAFSRAIVLKRFLKVEEQNARKNVERVLNALSNDITELNNTTADWAAWDETYAFIKDANPEYVKVNIPDATFRDLRLNLMLFIDVSGRIVFGRAFDLQNIKETPVPESLLKRIVSHESVLRHPNAESSVTGILLLPEDPLLIASRPILTGQREGPIRGTLIFGRYLDHSELQRLIQLTQLSISVRRFDEVDMPPDFRTARSLLLLGVHILIRPISSESIAGYSLIKDVHNEPCLLLRVDMARDVYKQGLASVRYFIWLLVVAGLVFCLATAMLLDTVVLSRLSRLGALARRIGATGDLSARVLLPGRDELSELSREINSMLESLEQTQRSLRLSEEKFRDIFAESPIGIVLYDAAGRLVNVNLACLSIFGVYDVADVKGISLFDDPSVSDEIKDRLRKGETVQYETILDLDKVRQRNLYKTEKTGSIFLDVHITSLGTKGAEPFSGYLVQVQDITERKRMEEELRAVSLVDELTALYNRRGFFTLAAQQLKVAHRMNRTALLLFADLDGMKWINDTLGHSEGDQALKEIAGILKRNCRESDIVARTGGDEFAILAIEARMEATEFLIARLQDKIKEHNAKGINRFTLSLSIGTAHYDPEEPCSLDELLARADTLMYERKRAKSGFWNQRQP